MTDREWHASSQDELLLKIAEAKGRAVDPYAVVGGIVRMVAVDRWCNNLLQHGLIAQVRGDKAKITPRGAALAASIRKEWNDDVQDPDSV